MSYKRNKQVYPLFMVHGEWHKPMIALYMVLVLCHFSEHMLQVYQAFVLQWARADSGGLIGLWRPDLASSEVLHFTYNAFQLFGLLVLLGGFTGRARFWWKIAIAAQAWHFFEHVLLQTQYITKAYLYGAEKQMSLLEAFLPRIELHFIYNMLVVLPTLIALYYYAKQSGIVQRWWHPKAATS
ncbi:hypothetical protein G4Y79_11405 [Phototrophicus methaneseepsis]|uniref:Uncharacterized protein n=1 Tax=Phototrophicus methaneseepsis TaxID=2710758 RepID=A0A7S8IGQ4_9CHLR|nr:hypothetical protein [Phototrophicus methaneseepsis]QPC84942.1 hypothetical protein G4Y79_11405 [Phototrophicus methaneseepsis]